MTRQVLIPAGIGAKMPVASAVRYTAVLTETREGMVQFMPSAAFAPQSTRQSEADLAAFYKANAARYQRPERRTIRYAIFDETAVKALPAPSDAEVQARYKLNAATYAPSEDRRGFTQVIVPTEPAAKALDRRNRGRQADRGRRPLPRALPPASRLVSMTRAKSWRERSRQAGRRCRVRRRAGQDGSARQGPARLACHPRRCGDPERRQSRSIKHAVKSSPRSRRKSARPHLPISRRSSTRRSAMARASPIRPRVRASRSSPPTRCRPMARCPAAPISSPMPMSPR